MRRLDNEEVMFGLVEGRIYQLCCENRYNVGVEAAPFVEYYTSEENPHVLKARFSNASWALGTYPSWEPIVFWTKHGYYFTTED
jgi:hypothetical protein